MDSPRHCTTDPEVRALDLDEQFRVFFDFLLLICFGAWVVQGESAPK